VPASRPGRERRLAVAVCRVAAALGRTRRGRGWRRRLVGPSAIRLGGRRDGVGAGVAAAAPLPAVEPRRRCPLAGRPMTRPAPRRSVTGPAVLIAGVVGWVGLLWIAKALTAASPPTGFDLELLLRAGRDVAAGRSPYDPALVAGSF